MKKMYPIFAVVLSVVALGFAGSTPARASVPMSKACKAEIKKFKCDETSEASIHECLEGHEAHGKKNDGFRKACYDAHEAYEKTAGKEENEKHGS